ncbi:MAG: DNA polymerase I [Bacteroidales bacterium]|nr:DNA polymerase I [Bacteroidales bacterium]
MQKKLFLLDAMALIYRAYYAMVKSPRITSKGVNTSATLGFTNTLYEVLRQEQPTHIAVAFDTGAPTLRHADFADYKANREATPDDIINSIPYIKRVIDAFNIPMVMMDGYEADDVIGTLAKRAEIEGFQVYMMTSDKDYGQLLSDNIYMYKPAKFGQPAQVVDVAGICEKYGISRPEQLIDILGLWGDASDNIPGVPGVGEVKAKKLIAQFGSIENIYANIDEVGNPKLKQALIESQEQALTSKMLATIILDVPVECDFEAMKYTGPDPQKLKAVFDELEFRALSKRVFTDLSLPTTPKNQAPSNQPDLFSIPSEESDNAEENMTPHHQNYASFNHNYQKINKIEEVSDKADLKATLFFDWLTVNDKIAGFAFAFDEKTVYYHLLEEASNFKKILQYIFENERLVVSYALKQTFKYFHGLKLKVKATFFDLQIAHYLIQPEIQHKLEMLAESYLDYELMQGENELHLPVCEYVEVYARLYPMVSKELQQNNLESLFNEVEMPLAEVLADMEYTGVKLDTEVLRENSQTLAKDIADLEEHIYALAGEKFNIASPKQMGEILFEKLRIIENAKLTKTKQYQTGEEVLNKLVNKHPIVPLILEWRSLTKLKSTYIDALPQLINPKTGRIHTTFNQTVTSTGRLSSVNPNLQNIPIRTERGRDIRKAFVAPSDDYVIMAADYSQIELRIVAHVCGDERMIETFRQHKDIHASMAAHVYHVAEDEVTSTMRRNAKTVNFGILYGISAFGLAERLHIPQKEARELITDYFAGFPKISQYLSETMEFARKNGYVETLLGRRRYIKDITSPNAILRKAAERNAINAPIQGTAADLIKIAMVRIAREIKKQKLDCRMILQVHDELVFEVRKTEVERIKRTVRELMSTALQLSVPLDVDINEGKSWYEAH